MKTTLENKWVKAGSFNTRYVEAGKLGNPKIMMLHDGAFGASAKLCYSALIAELESDYHIFAPDLLGYGATDKAYFFDRSPLDGRLRHLEDFIDALGIDEALYVGCSFGGSLTIRALLEADNPLRMRGGFSIAGTGGPYRTAEGLAALGAYKPDEEGAKNLVGLLVDNMANRDEQIAGRLEESKRPGHWEALSAPRFRSEDFPRTIPADTLFDDLANLELPLRLLECSKDALMEKGWSETMSKLSPQISAVSLDVGHLANLEDPKTTAGLIHEFYKTLPVLDQSQ